MRRRRVAVISLVVGALVLSALPLLAQQTGVTVEAWRGVSDQVRALFEEAVAASTPLMEAHLNLALRAVKVRYVLFADKAAMQEGYQALLNIAPNRSEALLWSTGRAIVDRSGNYVFTRLDGFGRIGPDRTVATRHTAHELTHIVQRAVKQCPGVASTWIIEGWAEWAGFRVVDLAGLKPYDQQRTERIEVMRRAWERTLFPPLVDLTADKWAQLVQSKGSAATYGVALLAVERLIERSGHPALDAYCAAVRTDGRSAAFERIFGVTEPNYALEFLRVVQEVLGQ